MKVQEPSLRISLNETVAVPQLSVAVKVIGVGTMSHSTVVSAGRASINVGGVVSPTVIVCV